MRKITKQAIEAFKKNESFKKSNTEVKTIKSGDTKTTCLFLHDNLIAKKTNVGTSKEKLQVTSAGWETTTTKERLNGIEGVNVVQRDFQWYLNGNEWDGKLTTI